MLKLLLLLLIGICHLSSAQTTIIRDAEIEAMVKEVSPDSLRSYISKLVSFGTRHTLSTITDKAKGIGAARLWVVQKLNEFAKNSNGRMTAYLDTTTLQPDGKRLDIVTSLGNAMAVLKGTDASDNRIYIISGHLDSRVSDVMNRAADAPGANDDGSGVAAMLECARIMSSHAFAATVMFVAVSGEEQSLLGSTFLANKAKAANWNVDGMLNNDIVGSNNSNETNIINNTQLRVFSETFSAVDTGKALESIRSLGLENDGKSRQLARYVKEVGERYVDNLEVIMIYRNDRFLRGGDHTPFAAKGYAAVRLTEMNENYNHQHQDIRTEKGIVYGDLPEFVDYEYLRKNTAVNLATLASLAKAPPAPTDVKVDVRNLTNSTTLMWKAPATDSSRMSIAGSKTISPIQLKGYYILIRETTLPVWQKKIFTAQTTATIPYSKDNYFFAVQSVNEWGNESLPVLPGVSR